MNKKKAGGIGQTIELFAEWPGEEEAGLRSGHEKITVSFEYGGWDEKDLTEFLKEAFAGFLDITPHHGRILTKKEYGEIPQEYQ